MTGLLVRLFVKNSENTTDPDVRKSYGTLSGFTGVVCNLLLFVLKAAMGLLSGSIAVISDAFNNLSDCAGSMVTLLGYKLSSKPADKGHPFGHGRMEYLTALFIAILIIFMGYELMKTSVAKLFDSEKVNFSFIVLASLVVSVLVKVWMAHFNTVLGKRINSTIMLATAKDSRNDVIATLATILSVCLSPFTSLPVDGITGTVISVFILKSGIDIIFDTTDVLLGKPADPEIVRQIADLVCSDKRIIGLHDLIIHSYGPVTMIGSCHVEISSNEDFVAAHELVDKIEREINKDLHISMTIHMDPVRTDDDYINSCREMTESIVRSVDDSLSIHDFRVVRSGEYTGLVFDLSVPFDLRLENDGIKEEIEKKLAQQQGKYYTMITFDRN